jgi:hypothetical protein
VCVRSMPWQGPPELRVERIGVHLRMGQYCRCKRALQLGPSPQGAWSKRDPCTGNHVPHAARRHACGGGSDVAHDENMYEVEGEGMGSCREQRAKYTRRKRRVLFLTTLCFRASMRLPCVNAPPNFSSPRCLVESRFSR